MISSAFIIFSIMTINFSGRHFTSDIIQQIVRYYVAYKIKLVAVRSRRSWLDCVSKLIPQPEVCGLSNILLCWNIKLVE
ncbi:hypothetical protein BTN49_2297 (plasmid) [Candidatus Enterovibrio escicola]|uniref:Mobile element protein n=1 Tax=Candidatus Enterovibrio escicola TaxID=1927127 RepID=A0A2A5T1S4_9GAMM|nr:hypothetical protein BTN49_2297 [Candidatus Enterovibrio escacola]